MVIRKILYSLEMLLLLLLIVAFLFVPLSYIESRSFCIFYNLWGVKCLGCGITRAFFNILNGNILKAISYNPLIIVVFPILIIVYVIELKSLIEVLFLNNRSNSFLIEILWKIKDIK